MSLPNINDLLNEPPSEAIASQLMEWADYVRGCIERGDMLIGIRSMENLQQIPVAYRRAADYGNADAWLALAWWQVTPLFGDPDLEASEAAFHQAIKANVSEARLARIQMRWFFKRDSASEAEQVQAYQDAVAIATAEPHNADAIYMLALLTTHGFGTTPDPEAGFRLQQQAAELGHTEAMFELFVHHQNGLGVPPDPQAAFHACYRAAEAGHPRAMYNMGAFYAGGQGVEKNIPEAIRWYEQAADGGNPSALIGLAMIYGTGDSVEIDLGRAEELLDEAEYLGLDVDSFREQVGL